MLSRKNEVCVCFMSNIWRSYIVAHRDVPAWMTPSHGSGFLRSVGARACCRAHALGVKRIRGEERGGRKWRTERSEKAGGGGEERSEGTEAGMPCRQSGRTSVGRSEHGSSFYIACGRRTRWWTEEQEVRQPPARRAAGAGVRVKKTIRRRTFGICRYRGGGAAKSKEESESADDS